jgi:AraC-like DNA-binding protein
MTSPKSAELASLIFANARHEGAHATPVAGLHLFRESAPTVPDQCVQTPALAVVAQGAKELRLGDKSYAYDCNQYLVVSLDLPMAVSVTKATRGEPYLGLRFDLDLSLLSSLEANIPRRRGGNYEGLYLSRMTADLLDPLIRLLRLLARPQDIPVIAPLLQREVLYRLTQSEQGEHLRRIAQIDSEGNRIARAIAWLKANFMRPFSMVALADAANMSPSGLHHHFKAITKMSPLTFQKHLRLQEARRLMLAHSLDAATAAYKVGYVSPSQFSREYKRLFGAPPSYDVQRTRQTWDVHRGQERGRPSKA